MIDVTLVVIYNTPPFATLIACRDGGDSGVAEDEQGPTQKIPSPARAKA